MLFELIAILALYFAGLTNQNIDAARYNPAGDSAEMKRQQERVQLSDEGKLRALYGR